VGITVLKNNVPWGPFTRAQIDDGLARGDFTLKYLAHAPGLKEWLPLGEALHFVDRAPVLPPVPESRGLPPVPGVEAQVTVKPSPPTLPPPALPTEVKSSPLPPPIAPKPEVRLPPASYFTRFIAFLIDCAILFVPIIFIFSLGGLLLELQGWWQGADKESMRQGWALLERNFGRLILLMAIGFAWLYAAGLESSRWQATVGKQWMGMKVTDVQGERLGFLRATGRHAAKYLSALPCFLGFIMALFSSRGLALHDRLAGTRVVRK
jgi:uncharacterized RDD family membrane protein YckC